MKIVIAKVNQVLFDGDAKSLTVPGSAGEMTVLPHHEPLITTLKKGTVTVRTDTNNADYQIDGGVLEIRPDGATIIL